MPIASRRTLAPAPIRRKISRRSFFGGLFCFIALFACFCPFAATVFSLSCVVLGVASWLMGKQVRRRHAEIAARRGSGSICTFARGFDCRRTDTKVLRAVFEELQPLIDFPLGADDQLETGLHLDHEDLDFDIVPVIAHRTGRLLRDTKHNPYYGRVHTVADLVAFFCAQPLTSAGA